MNTITNQQLKEKIKHWTESCGKPKVCRYRETNSSDPNDDYRVIVIFYWRVADLWSHQIRLWCRQHKKTTVFYAQQADCNRGQWHDIFSRLIF